MLHFSEFSGAQKRAGKGSFAGASQDSISYHYDRGVDFYRLWLGEAFCYSAAAFIDPISGAVANEDYKTAQFANVDNHLKAVRAHSDFRLLDIGFGWGTLLQRAHQEFGVKELVGLTLSREQREFVTELQIPGAELHLQSYEDFVPEGSFDGITCVEAFEHFAKAGMSRDEKVAAYKGFFERCHTWLRPKGFLSMQFGVWGTASREMADRIVPRDVFPESDLPYFDEVTEASQQHFDLTYSFLNTEDYVRTLNHWRTELKKKMNAVVSESDVDTYRFYDRYLRRAVAGFKRDRIRLCRCVFKAK